MTGSFLEELCVYLWLCEYQCVVRGQGSSIVSGATFLCVCVIACAVGMRVFLVYPTRNAVQRGRVQLTSLFKLLLSYCDFGAYQNIHNHIHGIVDEILTQSNRGYTARFTNLEREIATLRQENHTLRHIYREQYERDFDITKTEFRNNVQKIECDILSLRVEINSLRVELVTRRREHVTEDDPIIGMFNDLIDLLRDEIHSNQVRHRQDRDTDALFVTGMHTDLMTKFDDISVAFGSLFQIMRIMHIEMHAIEYRVDRGVGAIQLVLITRLEDIMGNYGRLFQDTLEIRHQVRAIQTRVQTLDTGV